MSLSIELNSVDITARTLGSVSVKRTERVAGQASFSYSPSGTPELPDNLVGQSVAINWAGNRMFTGGVNTAIWDPKRRIYNLECSDFLQERFEGKTDSEIQALIPTSLYSTVVFGEREDGWQYALDLMSTTVKDIHIDRLGNLQTPDWAAKGTPDRSILASAILNNGAYNLNITQKRDIITQHKIKYEYRVNRWKQRSHSFSWNAMNAPILAGGGWCEWYRNKQFIEGTREQVINAAAGTGWAVDGRIAFTTHPASFSPGDGVCGGGSAWIITDEAQELFVIGAGWTGLRWWAQTITETYNITLDALAAQGAYGIITHEDSAARQIESDDAAFEAGGTDTGGWATDTLGDLFQDQDLESDRDNDIQTLIAIGKTKLIDNLRKNSVEIQTNITPTLELAETVQITTDDIDARGKVQELEHIISEDNATTRVKIAISRGLLGQQDALNTPVRPDTSPVHAPPSPSTIIPTYVGNDPGSPNYDPSWESENGFVTNRRDWVCSPPNCPDPGQIYPDITFRVIGPDIESEARDEVTALSQTIYEMAIPQDLLVLT